MVGRMEVARRAGVSPAVVSYVTNGSHAVSAATRVRVEAAIEELGYRPNAIARSLARSRTFTLGLLVPDSSNPYFAELSSLIEDGAYAAGYNVLLGNGADSSEREVSYIRTFIDHKVDAVIVCPSFDFSQGFDELEKMKIPSVSTDRIWSQSNIPAVVVDNEGGAHLAAEHLISHNRTNFACISGDDTRSLSHNRTAGWKQAIQQVGIQVEGNHILHEDFTLTGGWRATMALLEQDPGVDALFVASDIQALGAIRAIVDSGRVPGKDISLIGFDGIELGAYLNPRLTTVTQPLAQIADTILKLVIALIETPDAEHAGSQVLPTTLEIRESCGCTPH